MRKYFILILVLLLSYLGYGQGNPFAAYMWNGSAWIPATSTATAQALTWNPPPLSMYCYNTTLSEWVPADSSCFGGGGGGGSVTTFSAGNLSPLFTTSVATPTTTPALSFTLSTAAANTVFGNFTSGSATPTFTAAPTFSAANLTNFPTFNQNTTGSAGSVLFSGVGAATNTNALIIGTGGSLGVSGSGTIGATSVANVLTLNNSNSGAASGTTYNGSAAVTASANTFGAGSLANVNTWSAAQTISAAGAASTSPLLLSGTWETGGGASTNYPALYIKQATATDGGLSASGVGLDINAATGFTGLLINAQINGGATMFQVTSAGVGTFASTASATAFSSGSAASINQAASSALRVSNVGILGWSSTSSFNGGNDTGLDRAAAGVVEANLGTAQGFGGSYKATGFIGASYQQTAASATGGTCAMAGTTSCTITIGHTYTTPVCIVTQQSATLTGGASGCTVSGTTVTITSAVLNSETWGAFVFGNPN